MDEYSRKSKIEIIHTINISGYFHAHFHQSELIDPVFEIAHETFEDIYSVWYRKWIVEESYQREGELMPESIREDWLEHHIKVEDMP